MNAIPAASNARQTTTPSLSPRLPRIAWVALDPMQPIAVAHRSVVRGDDGLTHASATMPVVIVQ